MTKIIQKKNYILKIKLTKVLFVLTDICKFPVQLLETLNQANYIKLQVST